jgi:hypothetical protein
MRIRGAEILFVPAVWVSITSCSETKEKYPRDQRQFWISVARSIIIPVGFQTIPTIGETARFLKLGLNCPSHARIKQRHCLVWLSHTSGQLIHYGNIEPAFFVLDNSCR